MNLAPLSDVFPHSGIYSFSQDDAPVVDPQQAATLLHSLALGMKNRGSLIESPALVTNREQRVLAVVIPDSILISDPLESSGTVALRTVTQALKAADLFEQEISLHVLADTLEDIPNLGDIYNFGAHLNFSTYQTLAIPKHKSVPRLLDNSFREEALTRRKMRINKNLPGEAAFNLRGAPEKLSYNGALAHHNSKVKAFGDKWMGKRVCTESGLTKHDLMTALHELASNNIAEKGGPFAAAVADSEGRIIGFGANCVYQTPDPTAHGERVAIRHALQETNSSRLQNASLYSSSYTCIGCACAVARSGVAAFYYGNDRDTVLAKTTFTEGPLDPRFLSQSSVTEERVRCRTDLELKAFKRYESSSSRYLSDHSKTISRVTTE